ncbi:MAG TPA: PetM family cytochrome b6-f complex subunit 7 [Chroococcidiopsis sp.]
MQAFIRVLRWSHFDFKLCWASVRAIARPVLESTREETLIIMGGEIFNVAVMLGTLVLVGLSVGFLLLRLQGGEE